MARRSTHNCIWAGSERTCAESVRTPHAHSRQGGLGTSALFRGYRGSARASPLHTLTPPPSALRFRHPLTLIAVERRDGGSRGTLLGAAMVCAARVLEPSTGAFTHIPSSLQRGVAASCHRPCTPVPAEQLEALSLSRPVRRPLARSAARGLALSAPRPQRPRGRPPVRAAQRENGEPRGWAVVPYSSAFTVVRSVVRAAQDTVVYGFTLVFKY